MAASGTSTNAPSSANASWALCQACGHWQRTAGKCGRCGWAVTAEVSPDQARDGGSLRVLLELQLRSDGTWWISGLRSARLEDLATLDGVLRSLRGPEGPLSEIKVLGTRAVCLPSSEQWHSLRHSVESLVGSALNDRIQAAWPAPMRPSATSVTVAIRCFVLHPGIEAAVEHRQWLEVVPFAAAAAAAASNLDESAVAIECGKSRVGLGAAGDLLALTVRSPQEILVDGVSIASGGATVWTSTWAAPVPRDELVSLQPFRLPATAIRDLAAAPPNGVSVLLSALGSLLRGTRAAPVARAEIQLGVRGRASPLRAPLPLGPLPPADHIADLLLDLGSTTTKWAIRFRADGSIREHDQSTAQLVSSWGLEPYSKAEVIEDASGEAWLSWVAQALPALRYWVGDAHGAFLGRVHLSLPSTARLDVGALAERIGHTDNRGFQQIVLEHLVDGGGVVLEAEHNLLARHYLEVVKAIDLAARKYRERFTTVEALRRQQADQQAAWDTRDAERSNYNQRFWKIFYKKPQGPTGQRPSVSDKISRPADWMFELVAKPRPLQQVVLLDAGGLSLDIAILENHEVAPELSRSHGDCGGEALSRRIGRNKDGHPGTRLKAQLGIRWRDDPNPDDPQQHEYLEQTRELYSPAVGALAAVLGGRWRGTKECVVLLTGGGSRNPHLRQLVGGLVADVGLDAWVVDGQDLEDSILAARAFPEPLPELSSPTVERFLTTQRWSERRERNVHARYDKFAVVGGMLAVDAEAVG